MVLGLVVVYIYSVAAFALYADKFHDPDSSDVQYCATLLQCFITIFHYILIGGVSWSVIYDYTYMYGITYCPNLLVNISVLKS